METTDFLQLLKKAMADEIEAQRLYVAMLMFAPDESDKEKILELFKDESDHSAILESMTIKYTTGENDGPAERIEGVE